MGTLTSRLALQTATGKMLDRMARVTMQKLAQGQSADAELSLARNQLARLADLYESRIKNHGGDGTQGG